MAEATLLEENFTISSIISGKYDRVHRIVGTSQSGDISMTLDVNIELFPVAMGDAIHMHIASTLSTEGNKDESKGWRDVTRGEPTLADHYDYVCHGKVYRFEEGKDENMYAEAVTEVLVADWIQQSLCFLWRAAFAYGWSTQKAYTYTHRLYISSDAEDLNNSRP
jgi:DNA-directed RNA polymerases I, II, and III subunit RPABC3